MNHPDFNMVIVLTANLTAIFNLFLYCYFGKMATESYEKIPNCFYECNWFDLPPKLQKYFVIMIGNAQRPMYYNGFGIFKMNLETFNKIRKKNYFYAHY